MRPHLITALLAALALGACAPESAAPVPAAPAQVNAGAELLVRFKSPHPLARAQELERAGRCAEAEQLEVLRDAGRLEPRAVHNDAKIANVLFDKKSGASLCLIDLDTVMPGLVLHDFGDLVRSIATNAAEDEPDVRRVAVRSHYIEAAMEGYLSEAERFLTPVERQHLPMAGRVIALEQAARFLTDFLQGDIYYPVTRPNQTLDRTRTQYAVYEGLSVIS